MKTSEALIATKAYVRTPESVRKNLFTGNVRYICYAANCLKNPVGRDKVKLAIKQSLNGYGCLETWLQEKHGIQNQKGELEYYCQIQLTRHAWLDHLIEHYKSIGD